MCKMGVLIQGEVKGLLFHVILVSRPILDSSECSIEPSKACLVVVGHRCSKLNS